MEQQNGDEENRSITSIEIKESTPSITSVSVSAIFEGSKAMKTTYGLNGDTHMMKNIEWGAVAYLTESKYGRNGIEIEQNKVNNTTGGGDITGNKLQSSTGNEYGIYDLSGGAYEYVAGYVENDNVKNNGYNDSLIGAEEKYKNVYEVGETDSQANNYLANKGIKGDAVYETSTAGSSTHGWHGDYSTFPGKEYPVFKRGGYFGASGAYGGVFVYTTQSGTYYETLGFRVVLMS